MPSGFYSFKDDEEHDPAWAYFAASWPRPNPLHDLDDPASGLLAVEQEHYFQALRDDPMRNATWTGLRIEEG